jgi:nucleoside-diphosphate-sugar epimerase
MQKKILLTGATGFLGSHLLESFVSQGYDVAVLKRSTSDLWRISHLLEKVIAYDTDKIKVKVIFEEFKPEIIVHTACSYGRTNESIIDIINSNLIFGLELLEASTKTKVKTFINADSLLPRNINDYSLSKAQFTDWLYIKSTQIQVVNFKIEHMYGVKDDNKKFIPWLIDKMIYEDEIINLTSGIQKRDFIYITDIVNAFNSVIDESSALASWNEFDIGTNTFTEVKEFVLTIAGLLEKKCNKAIIQRLNFGSIPYRKEEIMMPQLDNRNLIALGWKHKVNIKEGVEKILNQYK